jgi:hypothetical protein
MNPTNATSTPTPAVTQRVSLSGRLTSLLGSLVIGTPDALGMPKDFYLSPVDRAMMPRNAAYDINGEWRRRIFVDHFRRDLLQRTARLLTLVLVPAAFVVGLMVSTTTLTASGQQQQVITMPGGSP